jgi:8-oxo-dGTP diphosphatase
MTTTVETSEVTLAVSTVIFALGPEGLRIPLVRRIRQPFEGQWALPGGPIETREALETAAGRNLLETTGLRSTYLEQLYCFGDVDRAPGEREAALASEGENVQWFTADELPPLAFDHNTIVDYALWRLRTKLEYSRIAQAFLGPEFTLAELRQVYEAVLQRPLDPANFRRQVESTAGIIATEQRVTGGRHRPPRVYRYDSSVALTDNGPLTSTKTREA